MTTTEHFAQNLKHFRKETGLTQQEVADKITITRAAYASYEEGRAEPSLAILVALSTLFDISVDDLLLERADC